MWSVVVAPSGRYRPVTASGELRKVEATRPMNSVKKAYEAPVIVALGSLHGLTQLKAGPICDINCFHNTSASPD